jgi:pilus assembly protein CpaE
MAGESILCVDDDKTTRKLVSGVLERQGYRVRTADDGLEALRAVAEAMPDLIITDVRMPYVNGLELTQRLRRNHRTARIPIIMLSGRKRSEEILAGYTEGADDYVPKPVDMAVLAAKVMVLLQRSRAPVGGPEQPAPLGTVIVFLRTKGGVGTTMLAVNAAVARAASGAHRVALLDLNVNSSDAAVMLDLQPDRTLTDLHEVAIAELDTDMFDRLALIHESGVRLVLASDAPESAELVSVSAVQQTLDRLRTQYDFILVDMPPGFSELNLTALDAAHAVYLITSPHVATVRGTVACLRVLNQLQIPGTRVKLVLNRMTPGGLENQLIAKTLGRTPDVLIPYISWCEDAANAGRPLVTYQAGGAGVVEMESLAASMQELASVAG